MLRMPSLSSAPRADPNLEPALRCSNCLCEKYRKQHLQKIGDNKRSDSRHECSLCRKLADPHEPQPTKYIINSRKTNAHYGIIFDVDGTLWDSTGIVAEAWSDYLIHTEHMDTDVSAKRLMGLFGQLLPDIAKALFPELPEAEQLRIIDGCCQAEHEALLRKCAPLYPDLEETLKILSSRFPLFIVSNCQAGYIEVFLKSTGFGHYFKGHLCPGDTGMAKAENIMKIREDNNLSDPVYIGDTIGDFNACQKAGVPFIFAEYGFGQVDKPDYRITRPFDLTEICR